MTTTWNKLARLHLRKIFAVTSSVISLELCPLSHYFRSTLLLVVVSSRVTVTKGYSKPLRTTASLPGILFDPMMSLSKLC